VKSSTQPSRKHRRSKSSRYLQKRVPGPVASIKTQGHLLTVSVPTGPGTQRGGGPRGRITAFSRASRKRMMDFFQTVTWHALSMVIFITLTYPQEFPDPKMLELQRRRFVERLRRKFPKSSAVYRLEFQKRGAPHWHFLWFGLPYLPKLELQKLWMGCIWESLSTDQLQALRLWESSGVVPEDRLRVFTRIEAITSWRKAIRYVSKYMAKVEAPVEQEGIVSGSEADVGASRPGAAPPGSCGFNLYTYLHGEHVGRWWGKHNRAGIPLAESLQGSWLRSEGWFWRFRRVAAKKWMGIKRQSARGFTLYMDGEASEWWRVLEWAMGDADAMSLRCGADIFEKDETSHSVPAEFTEWSFKPFTVCPDDQVVVGRWRRSTKCTSVLATQES